MVSGQAANAASLEPKVVVTLEPLKPYVDAIMDGGGKSTSLLRPGQEPHTMVFSPAQARALADADVVIMPDANMNPTLARILEHKKKGGAVIIELSKLAGAEPLPYAAENPWLAAKKKAAPDADKKEDEAPPKPMANDPHLWLDPLRMAKIAHPLAEALGKVAPIHRQQYLYNADKLASHLAREVDPALRKLLSAKSDGTRYSNKPFVPFITYHEAYQYFLGRYGLAQEGFITQVPDDLMGARSLHDAQLRARAVAIHCIITEVDTGLVKRIATESGARVITLNPERSYSDEEVPLAVWVHSDYDRLLYKVGLAFASCL